MMHLYKEAKESTSLFRLQVFCLSDRSIVRKSSEKFCLKGLSWLREQVCDPLGVDGAFLCFCFVFLNLYIRRRTDWKHVLIDSEDSAAATEGVCIALMG